MIKSLLALKSYKKVRETVISSSTLRRDRKVSILLLNAPCHGFGDVVFAMKLANYLREWYNADVKILTTKVDNFLSLGENKNNLYNFKSGKNDQCRRFRNLLLPEDFPPLFDLIFVAPLTADFEISRNDVKSVIPYSNMWNTYFFSEYNDSRKKMFDFSTGIGCGRYGMLFTDPPIFERDIRLKNPYTIAYIAETISGSDKCYRAYFEMICKKYHKIHSKLDIVVPLWIANDFSDTSGLSVYYPNIVVQTPTEKKILVSSRSKMILTIRGNIFPVPNKKMFSLMRGSVDDLLLTGDQSITDALSCCPKKMIWYQIAPWKQDFGKNLARLLPQKYLKKIKTSCGTIKSLKYHPNFTKFVGKWDFRKLARGKLDCIVGLAQNIHKVKDILHTAQTSRTLRTFKNKLTKIIL
jgi:hypothetical protein